MIELLVPTDDGIVTMHPEDEEQAARVLAELKLEGFSTVWGPGVEKDQVKRIVKLAKRELNGADRIH
jgi:hypothetical protein